MLKFKNPLLSIFILTLAGIYSCSPGTRITGSWVNDDVRRSYNNILVSVMTEKVGVKQTVEDIMAAELRERGVNAAKSITMFPPKFSESQMNDREAMLEAIRDNGHDAILTIALIDEETETRYDPGTATYAPLSTYHYYSSFWGYYTHWYPMVSTPGYYTQDRIYFVEINLYDARTEELVWSAQTETINPNSLERAAEKFAEVTVQEMFQQRLL